MKTTGQQWFTFYLLNKGAGTVPPPDTQQLDTDSEDPFLTDSDVDFDID